MPDPVIPETPTAEAPTGGPDFARRVVTRTGQVVEFDTPEAAAEALTRTDRSGRPLFTPDSPEARAARIRAREYGDRPIAAGAAGAARGATFGLSDVAGDALGYGEDLAALEELNPGASVLGEVVGSVAPVLLTGPLGVAGEAAEGASLVGRGARLLGAPTRAVAGLAEGAGSVVGALARGAGTSALRRGAGTVARLATEGAVEGALGEGGRLVTEAALGRDPDLTAEAILARLGSGALLGAGGGAILGGAGAAIGEAARGTRRLVGSTADLARRAWRDAVGTELSPSVARLWALTSGTDAGDLARFASLGADGRRLREIIRRGDDVYDAGTREVAGSLDALERGRAHAADFWSSGLKRDQVVSAISADRLIDQAMEAERLLESARGFTRRVLGSPGDYAGGTGAVARRLDQVLEARSAALARVSASGGRNAAADIFQALDDLKREVGRARTNRVIAGSAAAPELDELYEGLRTTLERADLWGDAAEIQATVNRAFTGELSTRRAFARRFLGGDGIRDDIDPFRTLMTTDTRTINGFLRQAGTVANETAEGTFEATIDSTRNLLRAMDAHLDLPASTRADIARALAGSENALATFQRVRGDAVNLNQWRRLTQSDTGGRGIMGAIAGSALGGPIGAAAASVAASPAIGIRALGAIERMAGGVTDDIGRSVRSFLRRTGAAVTDAGREAGRRVRLTTVGGAAAYRERIAQLDEDRRDPRAAINGLASRLDGMEAAPSVRNALVTAAVRGRTYLEANRPGHRTVDGQLRPTVDALPSAAEMSAFMRRARAVDNPLSVLADLSRGTLTPEAVDALRTVYPQLFAEIQRTVIRELATSDVRVPYDRRLALGMLLGIPTDPALHPEHMGLVQSTYAATAAAAVQPRPSSRVPDLAGPMMSSVDALAARRSPV